MKSLTDLNGRGEGEFLDIIDYRLPDVVLDTDTIIPVPVAVQEGSTWSFPVVVNITEIVNYPEANVEFSLTFSESLALTVNWGTLPSYMTSSHTGNTWSLTGFRSADDWELVKSPSITLPNSYYGDFTVDARITAVEYPTSLDVSWTTPVSVSNVVVFGPTSDANITSGSNQTFSGKPTFSDPGAESIIWTVTITPNRPEVVDTWTTTYGSIIINPATKAVTIEGNPLTVANVLLALKITTVIYQDMDIYLTYHATNSSNSETDTAIQRLKNITTTYTSTIPDRYFYTNTELSNPGPTITHSSYTGSGTYTVTAQANTASYLTTANAQSAAKVWNFFRTYSGGNLGNYRLSFDETRCVFSSVNSDLSNPKVIVNTVVNHGFVQEAVLNSDDTSSSSKFGQSTDSVAISGNGSRIAVGDWTNATNTGCLYIFDRSGTTWTKTYKLTSNGITKIGARVSMSDDGTVIAVGAPENSGTAKQGAVVIFRYSGGTWNETVLTEPSPANNRQFGDFVELSGNGQYLIVRNGGGNTNTYIYYRATTTFNLQHTITDNCAGKIVSNLSTDGSKFIEHSSATNDINATDYVLKVWSRSGTTWSITQSLSTSSYSYTIGNARPQISPDGKIIGFGFFDTANSVQTMLFYKQNPTVYYYQSKITVLQTSSIFYTNTSRISASYKVLGQRSVYLGPYPSYNYTNNFDTYTMGSALVGYQTGPGQYWDNVTKTYTFIGDKSEINLSLSTFKITANAGVDFEIVYTIQTPTGQTTRRNQKLIKA